MRMLHPREDNLREQTLEVDRSPRPRVMLPFLDSSRSRTDYLDKACRCRSDTGSWDAGLEPQHRGTKQIFAKRIG